MTINALSETKTEWEIAGEAWGHAAVDWAFRFEPHARDSTDDLFQKLRVGSGCSVLDMACGAGYALGRAERLGATTAGIDASGQLIQIAARRAPNAELVTGSMFALPWFDETFDVVLSFNGIWGGCQKAIDEAYRVLRPGGEIAITFWGPGKNLDLREFFIVIGSTAPGVADEMKALAQIGGEGVCEGMLEAAGFEVTERGANTAVLEAVDRNEMWRTLRSPGLVVPSLQRVGEQELRRQVLDSVERYLVADGSYRLVNELTHVIATKPR